MSYDIIDYIIRMLAALSASLSVLLVPTVDPVLREPEAIDDAECVIAVQVDPFLEPATHDAIAALQPALTNIELTIASAGDISIEFGGEWPIETPQLGWTAPDRRLILINPDHPLIHRHEALVDVIAHEFGHVFIGPHHVSDGSLLDPHLDGGVQLNDDDRQALGSLQCGDTW